MSSRRSEFLPLIIQHAHERAGLNSCRSSITSAQARELAQAAVPVIHLTYPMMIYRRHPRIKNRLVKAP